MIVLRQTEQFARWVQGLRDRRAKAIIASRLERLTFGHAGDTKSVGHGIEEMRIHVGPGYRLYFTRRGNTIIVLLCGGDKGSQDRDIAQAQRILDTLED